MPDYYGILGVNLDATLAEIKAAFRKKVMVCHPDRGGTHEQMVQVNEAWEILSNAKTRAGYDAARGNQSDSAAQERAAEQSARAQQHAQQYPRSGNAIDNWLDGLLQDFAETTYEEGTVYGFGRTVPSRNSRTGSWFVFAGILCGVVFGQLFLPIPVRHEMVSQLGQPDPRVSRLYLVPWKPTRTWAVLTQDGIFYCVRFFQTAGIGAMLGITVHRGFRAFAISLRNEMAKQQDQKSAESANAENPTEPSKTIVTCPNADCGQRLRVPVVDHDLEVRCRKCGTRFTQHPQPR